MQSRISVGYGVASLVGGYLAMLGSIWFGTWVVSLESIADGALVRGALAGLVTGLIVANAAAALRGRFRTVFLILGPVAVVWVLKEVLAIPWVPACLVGSIPGLLTVGATALAIAMYAERSEERTAVGVQASRGTQRR